MSANSPLNKAIAKNCIAFAMPCAVWNSSFAARRILMAS